MVIHASPSRSARRDPPKRIQRKRAPGWRAPDGAVYVGRPTRWGNPFVGGDAEELVEAYRRSFRDRPNLVELVRAELAGRDLMCWCPESQPCHADVLIELANGGVP